MAEEDVTRELLVKIDDDPTVSQKRLAIEMGMSVGMINWHVKRCVSKGLIKLQQAPARRYLYYLTPKGFSEKANLTAQYLQSSFSILRIGREQYGALLETCQNNGWNKIVCVGKSELTELAQMVAHGRNGIEICGVIDISKEPVVVISSQGSVSDDDKLQVDAFLLTHFLTAEHTIENSQSLVRGLGAGSVQLLVPEFLR